MKQPLNSREYDADVVENILLATNTYRMRVRCPELARVILPGQFFMIRQSNNSDPLLGRPFALYDIWKEQGRIAGFDFGYVTIGKMTKTMASWSARDPVRLWGPLGNGFPLPQAQSRPIFVAGGIGQTPFLAFGRELLGKEFYGRPCRQIESPHGQIRLLYGARRREFLAGLDDFRGAGIDVRVATDDGSEGHHGRVTDLLLEELNSNSYDVVYCCGPEAMMHAVANICAQAEIECWLSLESPMACGFGACFSCVVKVKTDNGWDYRRSCVEGPVFLASDLDLTV